ncbi:MAG: SUMF1/EgtB/PvdO family nonheme iron enzyme [Acidobacteria bacterium]|nr:SUMF1/EgtB/PvdO family nonheme iron enzyme [Acidobacteriota bacterium]
MRTALSIFLLVLMPLSSALGQSSARRALLVINSEYQHLPKLTVNAVSIEDLKSALIAAKFDVREQRNLTQAQLTGELDKGYLATLQPGDTLFFYYLGYPLQAGGDNFLLPVDFDPNNSNPANFQARSLTGFAQVLDERKLGLKLVVMDAPSQPSALLPRSTAPGLGEPDFTDIKDIAYLSSAAKNAVSVSLTDAERGLFPKHIAVLLRKPGTTLVDLLAGTQSGVASETPKLNPYYSTPNARPFRFSDPPPEKVIVVEKPVDEYTAKPHVNPRDRQAYVFIPAGKFLMGCAKDDSKCEDNEKPQHEVTISKAFWMGETETQVEAYMRFADSATPKRKMPGAPLSRKRWDQTNLPMVSMSPADAGAFCKWAGGRLPTEAEWEYAARGGKANEIVPHNAENAREKANFSGKQGNDRFEFEAPVRQFDPNGYGLFDMSGNVWELVSDFYGDKYFAESPKIDPPGPASGKEHVVRGGSWNSDPAKHLRISFRRKGTGGEIVGFRCVIPDSEEVRKQLR